MTTAEIRKIIARALGIDLEAVPEDAQFGSPPEWDSAGHMFIIAELEEALHCLLDNDDILAMTDLRAIQRLVEKIKTDEKHVAVAKAVAS